MTSSSVLNERPYRGAAAEAGRGAARRRRLGGGEGPAHVSQVSAPRGRGAHRGGRHRGVRSLVKVRRTYHKEEEKNTRKINKAARN